MSLSDTLHKLRPTKVRRALRRRWFEHAASHVSLRPPPGGVEDFGTPYGGWMMPPQLIGQGWTCYCVGAGGDVTFDLELASRYDATVRTFDAVEQFVEAARGQAAGEPRLTAHHAAIAVADGPLRMQMSHDPVSHSVSSAHLYDGERFVELPGRTLPSLMHELGDSRIDLLKLDIEGAEYEVLPTIDLRGLGVRIFAVQLHHTGTVRQARQLIAQIRRAGYEPVACRAIVKLTFVASELLDAAPAAAAGEEAAAAS